MKLRYLKKIQSTSLRFFLALSLWMPLFHGSIDKALAAQPEGEVTAKP